ncbi:MAG: redoxin domain-containing protein [Chloroflexota bacterium]|nr:redoxin domain-containing protein [Chloroflexota bacterium]
MAQLRQDYQEFVNRDTEVIAIGPDKPESFKDYWAKESIPFIGLANPGHTVLDLYGQQVKLLRLGRMPAQALIDKSGIIRYVHYGSSMSDITPNNEILQLIDSLKNL